MRITSGHLRGRTLKVPDGIRPTQDRVRQAVFSSLGEYVSGARVLDLYAGSGSYGLESWSRGAAAVTWVEESRNAFRSLSANISALAGDGGSAVRCVQSESLRHLATESGTYDLVFADPPYADTGVGALLEKTLRALSAKPIVRPAGVFVFECDLRSAGVTVPGWNLLRDRTYGKTRILFYQRHEADRDLSRDV